MQRLSLTHRGNAFLGLLFVAFFICFQSNVAAADLEVDSTILTISDICSQVQGTNAAGSGSIDIADASAFTVGSGILIITMQGASAGQYEFNTITSISTNTLTLQTTLANPYDTNAQVIEVPQYDNVDIINGAVLTCPSWDGATGGVLVLKATNLTLASSSYIDVSGTGFLSATGPGAGTSVTSSAGGGGGAYGGNGGDGYTASTGGEGYGSIHMPLLMGSAGGANTSYSYAGGNGGGIIIIQLTGTATINGEIKSNGQAPAVATTYCGGAGAGGSILLICSEITGLNTLSSFTANGGSLASTSYRGGGGGGGRIAIQCDAGNYDYPSDCELQVFGGVGYNGVYGGAGTVYIKEGTDENLYILNTDSNCAATKLDHDGADIAINVLYVEWANIDYQNFEGCTIFDIRNSNLTLDPASATVFDSIVFSVDLSGARTCTLGENVTTQTVTVAGLDASNHATLELQDAGIVADQINLNGYTTFTNDIVLESPLELHLSNTDNDITNNSSGHIRFVTLEPGKNSVITNNGTMEVLGDTIIIASGSTYQGTGSFSDADNNLTVQSGGSFISQHANPNYFDTVIIQAGATVTHPNNSTTQAYVLNFQCSGDFTIEDGVTIDLTGKGYSAGYGPGVGEDAYYHTSWPGRYNSYYYGGGGGGYGANGGDGYGASGSRGHGGTHYDLISNPTLIGSGGGQGLYERTNYNSYSRTWRPGAPGGGAFIANVGGTFTFNGIIKVDGAKVTTYSSYAGGGGGGAGGINITAGDFVNTNSSALLQANGGDRYSTTNGSRGGGGAGGHIAIKTTNSYSFSGTITTYGGDGYNDGGTGTIYIKEGSDEQLYIISDAFNTQRGKTYIDDSLAFTDGQLIDIQSADVEITVPISCNTVTLLDSQTNMTTAGDVTVDSVSLEITQNRNTQLYMTGVTGKVDIGTATLTGISTSYHSVMQLPNSETHVEQINLNGYTTFSNYGTVDLCVLSNTDNDIYNYAPGTITFQELILAASSYLYNTGSLASLDDNMVLESGSQYTSKMNTPVTIGNILVKTGATITQSASTTTDVYRTMFTCTGDFTLENGATINVNACGYPNSMGPGAGTDTSTNGYGGGGGSYGGQGSYGHGGASSGTSYDYIVNPTEVGSGGGDNIYSTDSRGGYGGGAVIIQAGGTIAINGTIYANGEAAYNGGSSYDGGGGSGGCINLNGTNISIGSTALMQVNGGSYVSSQRGGGGGGGRIALVCSSLDNQGSIQMYGGTGYVMNGGAGTMYVKDATTEKILVQGSNSTQYTTIIDDTGELAPLNLDLLEISAANVSLLRVGQCDQIDIVNAEVAIDPIASLTVPLVNITLTTSSVNRHTIFGENLTVNTVTMQGQNTSYHAELELESGSSISTALQTNGYTEIINYSAINLPATYTMSGTDNDITNYGSIILPTLVVSNYSYIKNAGTILPVDNDLTIQNGGTYSFMKTGQETFVDVTIESGGIMTHEQDTTNGYKINLLCTNDLLVEGSIDASQKGYIEVQGTGAGTTTSSSSYGGGGGGHGAEGGRGYGSVAGGSGYGSIMNPATYGSGGGNNSYYGYLGGDGGGLVIIEVQGTATVNGTIKVDGQNAPNGGSSRSGGGGAAGSINLTTNTLAGSGTIQANGGENYASGYYGGGGAGGRIAIYTTSANSFAGSYLTQGGRGYYGYGGAGTVYINNAGTQTLLIKNAYMSDGATTVVADDAESPSDLLLLDIAYAVVELNKLSSVPTLNALNSDLDITVATPYTITDLDYLVSSTVSSRNLQLSSEATVTSLTYQGYNSSHRAIVTLTDGADITSDVTLNGYTTLHNYTTINLPNTFTINNTDNIIYNYAGAYISFATLTLQGMTLHNTGTIEILDKVLTIASGSTYYVDAQLPESDYDLVIENGGTYVSKTTDNILFDDVTVHSGATMTHDTNTSTPENTLGITCSGDFTLETGAVIDVTGKGYTYDQGPGKGTQTTSSSYGGGGAAYGGNGARGYNNVSGGTAYGSISDPTDLGSGGGSTYNNSYGNGSPGGGAVYLNIAGTLTLNGTIRANGADVTSGSSTRCGGGGSGGSVKLVADTISGTETGAMIEAKGGNRYSNYYGGGGGGGRVALIANTTCSYAGQFDLSGGQGYYDYGGAGTAFIQDSISSHMKVIATSSTGNRELTPLTDVSVPTMLDSYQIEWANVQLTQLDSCTTMDVVNSDVTITTAADCTIDTLNVDVVSGALNNRMVTCGPNTIINNAALIGYSTSRQAQIELQAGARLTTHFETQGNTRLNNYADINLPSDYIISGTDNDIYNYATGSIVLPTLTVSANSYVQNYNDILPVDTNLTIDQSGIYDIAQSTQLNFTDVVVNGTLTHTQDTSLGCIANISCTNLTVGSTGVIDVSYSGYARSEGPGAGVDTSSSSSYYSGGGAGHAGYGSNGYSGISGGDPYGSITNPTTYGSGGGSNTYRGTSGYGGSGGGVILLNVTDTLLLDGAIKANGQNAASAYGGGAAGGSINITTATFNGVGSIEANGGDRYSTSSSYRGGSGSGGRIAINCTTKGYTGGITAKGGLGYYTLAGAGTVYENVAGTVSLYVKNDTVNATVNTPLNSAFDAPDTIDEYVIENISVTMDNIASCSSMIINAATVSISSTPAIASVVMQGSNTSYRAVLTIPENTTVSELTLSNYSTLNNSGTIDQAHFDGNYVYLTNNATGDITFPTLDLNSYSQFTSYGTYTIEDTDLVVGSYSIYTCTSNDQLVFGTLTIESYGSITHLQNSDQPDSMVNIRCTGDLNVMTNGSFNPIGRGYSASNGPGHGTDCSNTSYGAGGAGYGAIGDDGYSGYAGGIAYGSISNPTDLGSGGGTNTGRNYFGGSGGGAVVLVVDGTMTLDGVINVNGNQPGNSTTYNGGAGSGGSINITTDILTGSNTGSSMLANGASNYSTSYYGGGGAGGRIAVKCNTYSYPGSITAYGGYGRASGSEHRGGAGTIYKEINSEVILEIKNDSNVYVTETPVTTLDSIDVLIIERAKTVLEEVTDIGTATLLNSQVDFQPLTTLNISALDITQNISITSGNNQVTLHPNTTVTDITMQGSSTSYRPYVAIEDGASITGTLALNGYTYFYNYGDVALATKTNTYNSFYNYDTGSVTLENLQLGSYDYIFYGGAVTVNDLSILELNTGSTLMMGTLEQLQVASAHIASSATLTHDANDDTKEAIVNVHCTGDFVIDSGGQIDVSYKGYSGSNGPGAGEDADSTANYANKGGGGGAYGGDGGDSEYASSYDGYGGTAYGDESNPMDFGSGGGMGYRYTVGYAGGAGGGLILLKVDGTLTVNGYVKANGQDPQNGNSYASGGGGAGGGINITTNAIVGLSSSYIEANGGNYYSSTSYRNGGGGGGRIHIGYQSYDYDGAIRANKGNSRTPNNAENGTVDVEADPAGVITITPVPASLHANSNEVTIITAGPVNDSIEQSVADGTVVTVSATGGQIINVSDADPLLDGIQLETVNALVSFDLQAVVGTNPGIIVVEVSSVAGTAYGSANIPVIIGDPAGTITLTADPEYIVADGVSTTTITSSIITDAFGNMVPEGTYITVATSAGTITTADAYSGTGRQVQTQADGTISFVLRASSSVTTATVTADSYYGTAHGELDLEMFAGEPDKLIVLLAGESFSKASATGKIGTPSTVTAGTPRTVTVMIVDESNNLVMSSTETVELISAQEFSSIVPAQQAFDGSTATMTFIVTEYIAQSDLTLDVNYLSDASFDTTSAQYTIQPDQPASMQIILPGETAYPGSATGKSGTAQHQRFGQLFWITVNMVDQYFNKITGRTDLVTLTSNAASATLPQPNLSNGSAYCSVTIDDLGLGKTITASVAATTVADGDSSSFGVFNSIPSILSVDPTQCKPGINKIITVSGDEFASGATVEISDNVDVIDVMFVDQTQLIVTIYVQPTAAVGARDVRVINPDQADALASGLFEVRDDDPPVVSNITVPAGATIGDVVSISFDVDELLGAAPVVTIAGYEATYQSGSGGYSYTYSYTVDGTEAVGYVPVYIETQDFVGNVGYGADHVVFDFYDPVIASTNIDPAIISPNGDFLDDFALITCSWTDESDNFDVTVQIYSGLTLVKTLWDGAVEGRYFARSWDGTNDIGSPVSNGNYLVKITIYDPALNSLTQNIGSVGVDYTADQQPYIIFTEEVQFATVGNGIFSLPISLTNNDLLASHTLSVLDVINTDPSVATSFITDPSVVSIAAQGEDTVYLSVDSSDPDSDRVDVQLRLVNESAEQVDYSNLRIYMNPVPKPDLVITSQDISFDPQNPTPGSSVTISVTVRNVGNEAATDIPVQFTSFGTQIGSGIITISSLAAGEETTFDNIASFAAGMKLISVEVDPEDVIDELDDYNNDTNKMLFVGETPLLNGGIRVLAQMKSVIPAQSVVKITGSAAYSFLLNDVPNYDYVVKGGAVYIDVKNTNGDVLLHKGGWYTDGNGEFTLSFTMPAGFSNGDYALVKITVTDYTLLGRMQLSALIFAKEDEEVGVTLMSPDIDGDGISNSDDPDIDGDGILNENDDDIDGDGIPNEYDIVVRGPITGDPDIDGDGIPNYYDDDIDGDGIGNGSDSSPYGGSSFYGGGWGGGFSGSVSSGFGGSGYHSGRRGYFGYGSGGSGYSGNGFGGISIPSGGKILTGTGESNGGYQGAQIPVNSTIFDAYIHSQDIAFSNDNPQLGEEITISSIIWAEGYGSREDIPVEIIEIYPLFGDQQIGSTQYIPSLSAGQNAVVSTSWQNFAEGLYIIETKLSDSFTDSNSTNDAASRALIVGQLNQLLDVVINLPIDGMTYLAMKDVIELKFEVWSGVDMLTPADIDTLVVTFSDSLALVSDLLIVKDGVLQNASFNTANNVFTVQLRAPLPVGTAIDDLFPGTIQVIAQRIDEDEVLNGSASVDINLTAGATPPGSISTFATSYAVQITWPEVVDVNRFRVYREDAPLAEVTDTQISGVYSYIDYYVVREETYTYFTTSYDTVLGKEGIVTSPIIEKTVPTRRRR